MLFSSETLHSYNIQTDTVTQYTLPAPFNNLDTGPIINSMTFVPALQRWIVGSSTSETLVTVGLTTAQPIFAKNTVSPVAYLVLVGTNDILIGFSNTITSRFLYRVTADNIVFTVT